MSLTRVRPLSVSSGGQTPLDLALLTIRPEVAAVLREFGANTIDELGIAHQQQPDSATTSGTRVTTGWRSKRLWALVSRSGWEARRDSGALVADLCARSSAFLS